jgi:hypothetical protein
MCMLSTSDPVHKTTNAIRKRQIYLERKNAGLCTMCGARAKSVGLKCDPCREIYLKNLQKHQSETYTTRKSVGLCTMCGKNPAVAGKSKCGQCHEARRGYNSPSKLAQPIKRADRIASNLCYRCGQHQPISGMTRCEKCRERRQLNDQSLKRESLSVYGGVCACCGESDVRFLTIDHINGGGNQHRREINKSGKGGRDFRHWLKRNGFPPGFQVLCWNCNVARHFNGGVCPHQDQYRSLSYIIQSNQTSFGGSASCESASG